MKKTCLLLSMVLFACGSEVSERSGRGPASDQANVPGSGGPDGAGVPVANDLGTSESAEGSGELDILPADVDPTLVPSGSSPTRDAPAPDGPPTTTDPAATADGGAESTDPMADAGAGAGATDPASGDGTGSDPTAGDDTDSSTSATDGGTAASSPCALTYSGKSPSGNSYGSGSQDGEGSSTWACGGPQ